MNDAGGVDQTFWAWDQYWRDGRLASCGGEGGTEYQAAITERWREFFRTLPGGCRILDVCTGNGAVARVAEETALERGIRFEIEAFDGAVIATSSSPGDMIGFRSRVPAESLPYPDDSFDAVVGQYGIEYSDMERSVPELARVSAPGCRVRLMAHAREGVVVGQARRQLDEARQLLDSPLFTVACKLAEAREAGAAEQARELTDRYNASVRQLEQMAADSIEPVIYSNTCSVLTHALSLQNRVGAKRVRDKIDEVADGIKAHVERLDAMARAALDERGARALAERIGELWEQDVHVSPGRRADGDLLGWIIESAE